LAVNIFIVHQLGNKIVLKGITITVYNFSVPVVFVGLVILL